MFRCTGWWSRRCCRSLGTLPSPSGQSSRNILTWSFRPWCRHLRLRSIGWVYFPSFAHQSMDQPVFWALEKYWWLCFKVITKMFTLLRQFCHKLQQSLKWMAVRYNFYPHTAQGVRFCIKLHYVLNFYLLPSIGSLRRICKACWSIARPDLFDEWISLGIY